MSTKKKIIISVICVAVILAICGCIALIKKGNTNKVEENLNVVTQEAQVFYEENVAQYVPKNRILVVYFTKDGHTEELAETISLRTGATLQAIDTIDEYPEEYEECVAIAQEQKNSGARPEIRDLDVNIADFSTIFVGYPIWLEDMPMAIYTFLEANDFTGKTVIPFATSKSSGESGTFEKIKNMLNTANVLDGLHYSEDQINSNEFVEPAYSWVDGLQLNKY